MGYVRCQQSGLYSWNPARLSHSQRIGGNACDRRTDHVLPTIVNAVLLAHTYSTHIIREGKGFCEKWISERNVKLFRAAFNLLIFVAPEHF